MQSSICRSRAGETLLTTLLGAVLLASALYAYIAGNRHLANRHATLWTEAYAEGIALELSEAFRAMSGNEIDAYLKTNPAIATNPRYPLCAHVNIMDRGASQPGAPVILNPDPHVQVPRDLKVRGISAADGLNRYYQVQVVDATSLSVKMAYCDNTTYDYPTASDPNEKFFVTTWVSWIPPGGAAENVKQVALSTLVPK